MKDLINETNTLNPEPVTFDEAAAASTTGVAKNTTNEPSLGRQNIMSQINNNTLNTTSNSHHSTTRYRNIQPLVPKQLSLPIQDVNDENRSSENIPSQEDDDDDVIIESEISGSNRVQQSLRLPNQVINLLKYQ